MVVAQSSLADSVWTFYEYSANRRTSYVRYKQYVIVELISGVFTSMHKPISGYHVYVPFKIDNYS